jgi:hypothetical protein
VAFDRHRGVAGGTEHFRHLPEARKGLRAQVVLVEVEQHVGRQLDPYLAVADLRAQLLQDAVDPARDPDHVEHPGPAERLPRGGQGGGIVWPRVLLRGRGGGERRAEQQGDRREGPHVPGPLICP